MSKVKMERLTFSATDMQFEEKEDGNKKFTGVAYSGSVIPQHGFFSNVIIDLENAEFKQKIPLFRDHDSSKIVGVGKLQKVDNQLMITGEVFDFGDGGEVIKMQRAGLDWELSVGINVEELELTNEEFTGSINGLSLEGEHTVLRRPTVKETSFVAIGADSNTSTNFFSWFKKKNNENEIEVNLIDNTNPSKDVGVVLEEQKMEKIIITKENIENIEFSNDLLIEFGCGCQEGENKTATSILEQSKTLKEAAEKWTAMQEEIKAQEKEEDKKEFEAKIEKMSLTEEKAAILTGLFESEDKEKLDFAMLLLSNDEVQKDEEIAKEEEIKAEEKAVEESKREEFKEKNKELFEFNKIETDYAFEQTERTDAKSLLTTARKLVADGKFSKVGEAMVHLRNNTVQ